MQDIKSEEPYVLRVGAFDCDDMLATVLHQYMSKDLYIYIYIIHLNAHTHIYIYILALESQTDIHTYPSNWPGAFRSELPRR